MVEKALTFGFLKLPVSNRVHVDVERLEETLELYERDKYVLDLVPRLR